MIGTVTDHLENFVLAQFVDVGILESAWKTADQFKLDNHSKRNPREYQELLSGKCLGRNEETVLQLSPAPRRPLFTLGGRFETVSACAMQSSQRSLPPTSIH